MFQDIFITSFQCPNLQKAITKKKTFFFKFSLGNLLIIFYQLTMFEAASYNLYYKFSMPKFAKGNNSKKTNTFF